MEVSKDVAKVLKKNNVEVTLYNWDVKRIPDMNIIFIGNLFSLSISYLQRFLPERNVVAYSITEGIPIVEAISRKIGEKITFITPSLYTKQCLEQAGLTVTEVIQHGVDLNPKIDHAFHDYIKQKIPQPSKVEPSNIILNISGNVQRKALDKQMIAYKSVEHMVKDAYYILHSGIGDTNIIALQTALELKRFWFTNLWGVLAKPKIQALYALCDFYSQASFCEGFGLTYLEAFAHNKPVIGIDCSGVSEIVKDGYTGILLAVTKTEDIVWQQRHAIRLYYYDIDSLIDAILVLCDQKTRRQISENVKKEKHRWNMENHYKKFLKYLI